MKYDLSCIIGKNDISFFQKYDLTLRRKMKDDLSQKKIHGNMIFSSNVLKRWSFQKRLLRWAMIFIVLSGKMVFFPENMIFLPWKESERQAFPRNTWNMKFSVYTYRCYKRGAMPLCQKKSNMILYRKNTPEGD